MDNTATTYLKDLVDSHTFIENPLDVFDSYTYTLEWFVCDGDATRKFALGEAFSMGDIIKDAWPGEGDNYITIAKTGVTTEFNITDLTVDSVGVGNGDYSKIAGTAYRVNFTVTQIGNTSLSDSLQNVVALCGFTGIGNAEYFIKINFVGYGPDGKKIKIDQTKIIPFKLINYQQLNTTSDARGTSTVLSGQVPADKVVMDSDVSLIEHPFEYPIGDTLEQTLDNFFAALNTQIDAKNKHLDADMKHTYEYEFSDQMKKDGLTAGKMKGEGLYYTKTTKEKPKKSESKGEVGETIEKKVENLEKALSVGTGKTNTKYEDGRHIGANIAGNHIYTILEEICFHSEGLRRESIDRNPGMSKLPKITPHLAMKVNGYNPVKGTQAYTVMFLIDYERKLVYQNMADKYSKMRNAKEIVQGIFDTGHVNKKYDYLFTGNNDQILDFTVSLDAELTKIYSEPEDLYAYEYFKKGGLDGLNLTQAQRETMDALAENMKNKDADRGKLIDTEIVEGHIIMAETELKESILHGLLKTTSMEKWKGYDLEGFKSHITPSDDLVVPQKPVFSSMEKNRTGKLAQYEEDLAKYEAADPYRDLRKDINYGQQLENIEKLKKELKELQEEHAKVNKALTESGNAYTSELNDIMATNINNKIQSGLSKAGQAVFDNIKMKTVQSNGKNLILAENLDRDFISKLSNGDFETILASQASNPITFRRLVGETKDNVTSKSQVTITTSETAEIKPHITMAREKYYEAKGGRLSMNKADMTIKGDPFWLEGNSNPQNKKKIFGNNGSSKEFHEVTNINGFPHLILKSGTAKGVDENENMMTRTMVFSLYIVTTITSTFSNGVFQQSLHLVKVPEAEHFPSETSKVKVHESSDTNSPGHPSDPTGNLYLSQVTLDDGNGVVPIDPDIPSNVDINGDPITKHIDEYTEDEIAAKNNKITTFDINEYNKFKDMTQEEREAAWAAEEAAEAAEEAAKKAAKKAEEAEKLRLKEMKDVMKSYGQRTGIGQEPITTAPKWLNKDTEKLVTAQKTTTDNLITAQSGMVGHFNKITDRNTRGVLASHSLIQLEDLHKACLSQQKGIYLPFAACDSIEETDKAMLESFGLTIEDQGKASTVTAMNNQINSWIANDGVMFSDEEIAVYQMAAGGELNITGHDPDDIQKLVKKTTLERTPQIILDEQANGITTENSYTEFGGADNIILDGTKPLNSETIKGTELNTITIQPYQNSDGSIKTDEDFEAEAEAIMADTTCVGQCRTKKLMLLGKIEQDAWKAQYKLDKIKDKKVDEIVNESCPEGTENKININNRRLECVPILPETLTDAEMNDVDVLKEEINKTLEENYYSESGIADEMAWKANAVELIETQLKDKDLIISDKDKTELKIATGTKINNIMALNELSDNDYRKIQGYETGIKTVIATAQDGHRGDLTTAVTVGKLQHELVALSAEAAASSTKLDGYYFDNTYRDVEVKNLQQLELDMAIKDLTLPADKTTSVATMIMTGVPILIPIKNPVEQIEADQAPILVKTGVNTMDIILPGSLTNSRFSKNYVGGVGWRYAMQNPDKVAQYTEAKKIYKILVDSADVNPKTVTDSLGQEFKVKDFSNIPPITYTDANGVSQTISNPSAYFGIYTRTNNDINPKSLYDYNVLKGKVSDLFPDVESGQDSELINGKLPTDKDGALILTLTGDKFYIDK